MKKKILLTLLLVLIGGASFFYYLNYKKLGTLSFDTVTIHEAGDKDKYLIVAEYPSLNLGIPKSARTKINNILRDFTVTNVSHVKADFEELIKDNVLSDSVDLDYVSNASIKNDFSKLPIINIIFETYYYAGGAHGISDAVTFAFDAKTGEKLELSHIFVGDYLQKLSVLSLQAIKAKDPNLETFIFADEGTKPDALNFKNFVLESDGIRIIFGDYQVAPYSVGGSDVLLPYKDLTGNLSEKFKRMLKQK